MKTLISLCDYRSNKRRNYFCIFGAKNRTLSIKIARQWYKLDRMSYMLEEYLVIQETNKETQQGSSGSIIRPSTVASS